MDRLGRLRQGHLEAVGEVVAQPRADLDLAQPIISAGGNRFDRFDQVRFWKTPTAICATQGACVPYSQWVTDYIAIMGGR